MEPSPIYIATATDATQPAPAPAALTAEHLEALRLAATLYGFSLPDWPATKVQRLLNEVKEALS